MRFAPRRRGKQASATFVGILDGRHLWLSLDRDETAALSGPGGEFPLSDVTDLIELLPAEPSADAAFDVLCGGTPVTIDPFPAESLTRVPVAPDGTTRFSLVRTDAGHLQVRRQTVEPTAVLEAIEMRGSDAHLTLLPPQVTPGLHLVLLDDQDRVLDSLPVTAHEGHVEALLGADDLPAGHFGIVRLVLGDDASWMRIRRRACDLVDAHHAVLLPELHQESDGSLTADADHPIARFRWNPDSFLVLRVLEPEHAPQAPAATVTPLPTAGGTR